MAQPTPLTHPRIAAAEPSTGRPPRLGSARNLEEPPTTPHGDVWGLARGVVGVAPRDGLHREGLPQHIGHAVVSAALGHPSQVKRPSTQTTRSLRKARHLEPWRWASRHVPVHPPLPIPVDDSGPWGGRTRHCPQNSRAVRGRIA